MRIGRLPVFGNPLAVGHAPQHHLVADQGIECRAELDGLINLAQHHTVELAGAERR
ncbi:MAG: hypothetical protein R3E42_19820 [Burkholderiaceae bacterium]